MKNYAGKIKIMMDSGVRSGADIARAVASGAEFVFLGRSFTYGVAALGEEGGEHVCEILKIQFKQVIEQVCAAQVGDLPRHLVKN